MLKIINKRFGRLKVISLAYTKNYHYYNCICDCGKEKIVNGYYLRNGNTKSCGCLHADKLKDTFLKHGLSKTRFYSILIGMKNRCGNPKQKNYSRYGRKGIKVCKRWKKFENFKDDMYESYLAHVEEFGEKNTSIDRINNNGNYEKSNCRWATIKEQNNNRKKHGQRKKSE